MIVLKKFLFLILLILGSFINAQTLKRQTVSSAGNSVYNNQQIIRQTIGQPYQTLTTYNNQVSYRPGFQQPIFRVEPIESSFSLSVYPNPTSFFLNLSSDKLLENVGISIHDLQGKLIYETELSNFTKHQIICNHWANGTYLLKVLNNDKTFSTKIILYR